MNIFTKARLLTHFFKWYFTWDKRNTHYQYTLPDNPKFMGPRDAVKMIPDGATLAISGLAANQRPSIIYWAIRELFEETQHPKDLTVMALGGIGGRGRVPGTLEELGQEGLTTRFFAGHTETFKSQLKLADQGKLELQCLPQGLIGLLFEAQGEGVDHITTETGVGTFVDPRTGRGTPVCDPNAQQYVSVEDDGRLRYTLPKIDVAIFNAPAADRKGNIYIKNSVMVAESREITRAAKRNGGIVIANVGLIVDEGYDDVWIPAEDIDAVVYYPNTEQTGSVLHRKHWPMFTLNSDMPLKEGIERARFINKLAGVTPKRTPIDSATARLAAHIFVENFPKGGSVDIGVGLPEEVSSLLFESGAIKDIQLLTESGVLGGVAAPGIFFGAALNPEEIVPSAEIFRRMYEHLDGAILGMLEADSEGNVNVSKRGEGATHYVGPGGFVDITTCANMIIFVGSWGAKARIGVEGKKIKIETPGTPKFVDKVDEITFCGQEALKHGKKVFYVTNVGAFQLTERGMEIRCIMPGVDLQKDIIDVIPMKVVLPESGEVPTVEASIITGENFKLSF